MKPTDHIIDDVLHNLKRLDPTKKKLRSKDFCFHETTCGCSTSRATSTMTVLGSLMLQASSLTSRMPAHTDQPLPVVSHSTPWILCVITSKPPSETFPDTSTVMQRGSSITFCATPSLDSLPTSQSWKAWKMETALNKLVR